MTSHLLDDIANAHRAGRTPGVTSVCSAHSVVLDETVRHGAQRDRVVLVEATCNQVNQDGGYTGMRPADFRAQVQKLAEQHGLPWEQLVLGGDHLGPNPWKHLPAETAMTKSAELVDEFVRAGYTKIHLDTSIRCADDRPGPLPPALAAERAARLAVVAERAASETGVEPRYVIGTEVPVPGGESSGAHGIHTSQPAEVSETVEVTQSAFEAAGASAAWHRVRAVVAQPGVEFSDTEIFGYGEGHARNLYAALPDFPVTVFEAHSTDYQSGAALADLVRDHFAILKVGPGLTFAYREAVFGLAAIESELLGEQASGVRDVLDAVMRGDPSHWSSFYPRQEAAAGLARRYSRSDRSRYYWPRREVMSALAVMTANLDRTGIPDELASQHLSWLAPAEPPGIELADVAVSTVLRAAIERVLDVYDDATSG